MLLSRLTRRTHPFVLQKSRFIPRLIPFSRFNHEDAPERPVYTSKRASWISPLMLLVGCMPVLTFGLGVWQLQRLKWKIALIDELDEKLHLEPLNLPNRINLSVIPEFIYRQVRLQGVWDHAHTMILRPRVREGEHGVHVITPLIRQDGSTVLINRGFISSDVEKRDAFERPTGHVEVLAMLRTSETRNTFTPDNDPEKGIWYWTDVKAMSEYAGGNEAGVQPVYAEEIFVGHGGQATSKLAHGIPIGRAPTIDLRNAHLSYIITWFTLSALTSFMFVRVVLNKRRVGGSRLLSNSR